MSLKEYRRKRDFQKTPEPAPGRKRKAGKLLTFVIQKHMATREHYDFRLEFDGAMKSWAVPKGPTLTSGDPRLAVHVEDHPLEYGKFEGVIPKGNYGAGTVMIWDCGTFVERGSEGRADSEKALIEGMAKGHITFVLNGHKLRGEFALVKIKKKNAPEKGWLLIKKHDAEASRVDVLKQDCSVATGRTMAEIAAQAEKKGQIWISRKKGSQSKAVQKRLPDPPSAPKPPGKTRSAPKAAGPVKSAFPHRIRPMEPAFSVGAPKGSGYIYEAFGRGIRAIAEIEKGNVRLYSRSLLPLEKRFPTVVSALRKIKMPTVLDGEIILEGKTPHFYVSDLLYLEGTDWRSATLSARKKALAKLRFDTPLALAPTAKTPGELAAYRAAVVAKQEDSLYRSGLTKEWLRFRPSFARSAKPAATQEKPPLTHLSKPYWPDEKITKGDLLHYYEQIADTILPYLVDRPQSLHRQPDGIRNEGFFHKDMTSFLPRRIETVRVLSASSGRTINYVLCQDKWALLFLVNMGCIELNPWLSRKQNLNNPDLVVIDLDPDDNSFDEVVKVAREVQKVLLRVGAESFCKTSGASGLHICIPTGGRFDFDTGRLFAEDVCKIVQAALPKLTSVERNPARRRGRIYLDFLQNRRGQTLAAPYCVRPRPKATVSAPVKWSEVKAGLDPQAFTIHTMSKRLARVGDLWKPLLRTAVDIAACHRKLSELFHN